MVTTGEENGTVERGEHDKLEVTIRQRENGRPRYSQVSVNWEEVPVHLSLNVTLMANNEVGLKL